MSFSLTKKSDYALVALSRLEVEAGGGQPISARHIADEFDLPLPIMMNVLKDLAGSGLVRSKRGATGGYYLSRPAQQITFADVIEAIEGPVSVTACCDENEQEPHDDHDEPCLACRLMQRCPITGSMRQFNDLVVSFLRTMTLADMMREDLHLSMMIRHEHTGEDRTIDGKATPEQTTVALNNAVGQQSGLRP